MNRRSIVLLSGGLDSLVSLGLAQKEYNVELALTFDYGQKSVKDEIDSSAKICSYYGIKHKVIKLDWLCDITKTALVSDKKIPEGFELSDPYKSMQNVWVPNRNGLFLNIAGVFADSGCYSHIVIGANKEEGETFSDNTKEFIERINAEFEYSTLNKVKVVAPLIELNKKEIIELALKKKIPLEYTMSCYRGLVNGKHCGICESCTRLKSALKANHAEKYLKLLF